MEIFGRFNGNPLVEEDIEMDEHIKMSDIYMRTGPYKPKNK